MALIVDEGAEAAASYDEWIGEVTGIVGARLVGGVAATPGEISEVLGGGWQAVYEAGETAAEAAELMCSFILEVRREAVK